MRNRIATHAVATALLTALVGCGGGAGGTGDPATSPETGGASPAEPSPGGTDEETSPEADGVLSGVFIDSPVAGLAWETETRSGISGEDGAFDYLPGESVTFSIGALRFPTTAGAERLTPMDLARGANDPERFAVNLARLLQTLDADGDPENGIALPAGAADASRAIDFDVDAASFEGDPAVVNLVVGAGGVRTALISEERARQHFGLALAETGSEGATPGVAGFWKREGAPLSQVIDFDTSGTITDEDVVTIEGGTAYHAISADGEWQVFTQDWSGGSDCFGVDHRTLTPIGDGRYLASSVADGGMRPVQLRPEDDALQLTESGRHSSSTSRLVPATGAAPETLTVCAGQSLQRPPPGAGLTADIAGLWETADEDGVASYLHVSSSGTAEFLRFLDVFGPAPAYVPNTCLEAVELEMSATSGPADFRAMSRSEERDVSWRVRREGDALAVESYDGYDDYEQRQRHFERSDADPRSLARCGTDTERHPLDEIAGLWRNDGDELYGSYVQIDAQGRMKEYLPSLGGLHCFVETESTLVSTGALDFIRQLADGTERTLRMEPGGERLVISDVAADGSTTPVRWLEAVPGLRSDFFSLCRVLVTPEDLASVAPLVGTWSRTLGEYDGPYGPDRSIIVYSTLTEYWTIGSNGLSERVEVSTELLDRHDGLAEYRTCRRESYRSPEQMEPLGADVYRLDSDALTIERSGETLRAASSYDDRSYRLSDIDPSDIEPCSSGQDPYPGYGGTTGLWELAPFELEKAGALFLFDVYQGYVYRPGENEEGCDGSFELQVESLADGRFLLSGANRSGESVSGIGRLALVDGELRVELESADEGFPLADGSYPRVRGFDADELRYRGNCY